LNTEDKQLPKEEYFIISKEAQAYAEKNKTEGSGSFSTYFDCLSSYTDGATVTALRFQPVVEALERLIELKKMKDQNGKDAYYKKYQPIAWQEAEAALKQLKTPE